jgi:hypothetical protein
MGKQRLVFTLSGNEVGWNLDASQSAGIRPTSRLNGDRKHVIKFLLAARE